MSNYANARSDVACSAELPGHDSLWFLHIPGNAGGSIRKAMGQHGGNHKSFHHHKASKMIQVFAAARDKQIFTVIRDPVDRALKAWSWAGRQRTWGPLLSDDEARVYSALFASGDPSRFFELIDFEALAKVCHHFTPQVDYVDAPSVRLITLENLQDELDGLTSEYGGARIVLPVERVHESGRPAADTISSEAVSRILKFYFEDYFLHQSLLLVQTKRDEKGRVFL
tara:strand:+ start:890 stop:1567 length:678 start_codon:yes stop_codon:yes gene_type:complete